MLAGHFLPHRLTFVIAELNRAAGLHRIQKDPSILRHFHVAEIRPAVALNADRGAQINVESVTPSGPVSRTSR